MWMAPILQLQVVNVKFEEVELKGLNYVTLASALNLTLTVKNELFVSAPILILNSVCLGKRVGILPFVFSNKP